MTARQADLRGSFGGVWGASGVKFVTLAEDGVRLLRSFIFVTSDCSPSASGRRCYIAFYRFPDFTEG